jgi:FMN phosphatase YigB (HAD superfamily)
MDDLRAASILDLVEDVWLSDVVGLHKPDPRFFELALDAWQMDPARVAYVGDRPDNDVEPARRLGMHTVRFLFGSHARQPPRDAAQTADFDATSLAEVAQHLTTWAHGVPS